MTLHWLNRFHLNLGIKRRLLRHPLMDALVAHGWVPHRLKLPVLELSEVARRLNPQSDVPVEARICCLPENPWDTGYGDLVPLVALSRLVKPRRILEVGTCRGRATVQLALNHPEASITTYDIDPCAGEHLRAHPFFDRIEIRIHDFRADAERLRGEARYDLIFIDALHTYEAVRRDSELALDLVTDHGMIVWHDYCNSGWLLGENGVPEYLHELSKRHSVFALRPSNLAVLSKLLTP